MLDELFAEEKPPQRISNATEVIKNPSLPNKYRELKWKINTEDKMDKIVKKDEDLLIVNKPAYRLTDTRQELPIYALIIKLKPQYRENGAKDADKTVKEFKKFCKKFDRLVKIETIKLGQEKGFRLLWCGFWENDRAAILSELSNFVEECPLFVEDVTDEWDLIDLATEDGVSVELPGFELGESDLFEKIE